MTVVLLTYLAVTYAFRSNATAQIEDELRVGGRVFTQLLETRGDRLQQTAEVLAADFGLRQAVATGDRATIVSVLENHGSRIGADVGAVLATDGSIVASTSVETGVEQPSFAALLEEKANGAGFVASGGRAYQVVVVPVRAPLLVGWAGLGFAVDDALLQELKQLAKLEVTFWRGGAEGEPLASTLPAEAWGDIARLVAATPEAGEVQTVELAGERFLNLAQRAPAGDEADLRIVLHQSLNAVLAPYQRLQQQLLGLAIAALVISTFIAFAIARGVSRPVRDLVRAAGRVARGDYSIEVEAEGSRELDDLASTFNEMSRAVRERERRVTYQAMHDDLTGLPNRRLLRDRLQQALAKAKRSAHGVAVILLDLDRFKEINDALGHHIGDQVLEQVGDRLRRSLRESDTVARLGGDEFAVLLTNCGHDGAERVATEILHVLQPPVEIAEATLDVGVSLGIALSPEHGNDATTLMRRADSAMYLAKDRHARVAVYEPHPGEPSIERLSLMTDLGSAVDREELVLHFQPKIDLQRDRVTAVEALARWQHPEKGLLGAGSFIPLAERTGKITLVTYWALAAAVHQHALWRELPERFDTAVNMSAFDLVDGALTKRLNDLLEQEGLEPSELIIEITESAVMRDPATSIERLKEFRDIGVKLAVDDFGTGYSSLAYLRRLPVDELKIDKTFVLGLADSSEDRTLVRSTIDLAHNLGIRVTAEGVEEKAALELLREYGCDTVQGFYFTPALPPAELVEWMMRSRRHGAASEEAV